jgi:hypothetical protein
LSAARRLELRPSAALAAAIMAAHAAAALSAWFLVRGAAGALVGGALLALGAGSAWRRALLRGRGAVRALELAGEEVVVQLASGEAVRGRVAPRRYVSRLLVTLRVGPLADRVYGGRTLLVTADMLGRGEFRRLRVWALWGKLPDVAAEQLAR